MFDSHAVVWALMHDAIGGDELLEQGIRNMGKDVWPQWLAVYEQPALFELRDDYRPQAARTAAGRYREPSLLDLT
jgi:hypothetical protein